MAVVARSRQPSRPSTAGSLSCQPRISMRRPFAGPHEKPFQKSATTYFMLWSPFLVQAKAFFYLAGYGMLYAFRGEKHPQYFLIESRKSDFPFEDFSDFRLCAGFHTFQVILQRTLHKPANAMFACFCALVLP